MRWGSGYMTKQRTVLDFVVSRFSAATVRSICRQCVPVSRYVSFGTTTRGSLDDDDVLALVPDFALDDRTARFFGGERLVHYDQSGSGVGGGGDLNILAMELAELLDAVDNGISVEVGAEEGLLAVALVMACHESSEAGRTVHMEEVVGGRAQHLPERGKPRVRD